MTYIIRFENDVLRISISDAFTSEDIAGIVRDILQFEAGLPKIPHRIVDISAASQLAMSPVDLRQIAEIRRPNTYPNIFKSAIVVTSLVQFGTARMFQILNDHPQIRVAIFPTVAAAEAWLNEPGFDLPAKEFAPRPGS